MLLYLKISAVRQNVLNPIMNKSNASVMCICVCASVHRASECVKCRAARNMNVRSSLKLLNIIIRNRNTERREHTGGPAGVNLGRPNTHTHMQTVHVAQVIRATTTRWGGEGVVRVGGSTRPEISCSSFRTHQLQRFITSHSATPSPPSGIER